MQRAAAEFLQRRVQGVQILRVLRQLAQVGHVGLDALTLGGVELVADLREHLLGLAGVERHLIDEIDPPVRGEIVGVMAATSSAVSP